MKIYTFYILLYQENPTSKGYSFESSEIAAPHLLSGQAKSQQHLERVVLWPGESVDLTSYPRHFPKSARQPGGLQKNIS